MFCNLIAYLWLRHPARQVPYSKLVVSRHMEWVKAKQKNMCVSGYMLLKIRVGRSDYFFLFFEIILDLPEVLFIKTELVYLHFQPVT